MLKAVWQDATSPNQTLILGLSHRNLTGLIENRPIRIKGDELGIPINIIIAVSPTSASMLTDRGYFFIGITLQEINTLRNNPHKILIDILLEGEKALLNIKIFSGETEMTMAETTKEFIGPNTTVKIDPRLKN